jgi:hypothetical protein
MFQPYYPPAEYLQEYFWGACCQSVITSNEYHLRREGLNVNQTTRKAQDIGGPGNIKSA